MSDPYASERYNPTLPHCGRLRLSFDGQHLYMSGGTKNYSFAAVSGKKKNGRFEYSSARQKIKGTGPIPEGIYWIRPDELDDNLINTLVSGAFERSWGRYRISIHPFLTTQTHGRGGFFIHGGSIPGSAGCIDLTAHMPAFVAALKKEILGYPGACQIHLTVAYPIGPGDFQIPDHGYSYA